MKIYKIVVVLLILFLIGGCDIENLKEADVIIVDQGFDLPLAAEGVEADSVDVEYYVTLENQGDKTAHNVNVVCYFDRYGDANSWVVEHIHKEFVADVTGGAKRKIRIGLHKYGCTISYWSYYNYKWGWCLALSQNGWRIEEWLINWDGGYKEYTW